MKMKKLFLLFSMITVLFSMTACSDGQGDVTFAYTDNEVILTSVGYTETFQNIGDKDRAYVENEGSEAYQTALANFDTTKEECGEFSGYRAKAEKKEEKKGIWAKIVRFFVKERNYKGRDEADSLVTIDLMDVKSQEEVVTFLSKAYAEVEENGENVVVTMMAAYEKRDVELKFVYEADPASAYTDGAAAFKLTELTATPEYTMAEKMKKAGSNTLMGMGTVFAVLIFISLIIGQFERISKIGTKKAEKTGSETASAAKTVQPVAANLTDDKQLMAVITAAIMAANGNAGSSDRLIVRSIKKAKR